MGLSERDKSENQFMTNSRSVLKSTLPSIEDLFDATDDFLQSEDSIDLDKPKQDEAKSSLEGFPSLDDILEVSINDDLPPIEDSLGSDETQLDNANILNTFPSLDDMFEDVIEDIEEDDLPSFEDATDYKADDGLPSFEDLFSDELLNEDEPEIVAEQVENKVDTDAEIETEDKVKADDFEDTIVGDEADLDIDDDLNLVFDDDVNGDLQKELPSIDDEFFFDDENTEDAQAENTDNLVDEIDDDVIIEKKVNESPFLRMNELSNDFNDRISIKNTLEIENPEGKGKYLFSTILFVVLVAVCIVTVSFLGICNNQTTSLFGVKLNAVSSETAGKGLEEGSLVIVEKLQFSEYSSGDVIVANSTNDEMLEAYTVKDVYKNYENSGIDFLLCEQAESVNIGEELVPNSRVEGKLANQISGIGGIYFSITNNMAWFVILAIVVLAASFAFMTLSRRKWQEENEVTIVIDEAKNGRTSVDEFDDEI